MPRWRSARRAPSVPTIPTSWRRSRPPPAAAWTSRSRPRARCKALDAAYKITRRGGTTVTCSLPPPSHTFNVPAVNLVAEERTLKGSYLGSAVPARDIPHYIALFQAGACRWTS
jgi:threonine dehydrogenase-like Zn-dependent dehydrogenase